MLELPLILESTHSNATIEGTPLQGDVHEEGSENYSNENCFQLQPIFENDEVVDVVAVQRRRKKKNKKNSKVKNSHISSCDDSISTQLNTNIYDHLPTNLAMSDSTKLITEQFHEIQHKKKRNKNRKKKKSTRYFCS